MIAHCRFIFFPLQNAYFTMRKNERHGKELVCSFPACRDSGIKFCWCSYCRVPVARRNFRLRHHHADMKQPPSDPKSKSSKKQKKSKERSSVTRQNSSSVSSNSPVDSALAAPAAMPSSGSAPLNASSLLLNSIAQAWNQQNQSGGSNNGGLSNILGQQQHALSTAPSAMEDVSRLGDSASSTSSSDGSAVKIPCRARGMLCELN